LARRILLGWLDGTFAAVEVIQAATGLCVEEVVELPLTVGQHGVGCEGDDGLDSVEVIQTRKVGGLLFRRRYVNANVLICVAVEAIWTVPIYDDERHFGQMRCVRHIPSARLKYRLNRGLDVFRGCRCSERSNVSGGMAMIDEKDSQLRSIAWQNGASGDDQRE